jgi:hypothetical protein
MRGIRVPKSYVGAYWGPRSASVDECAQQLGRLVTGLPALDASLANWRDLAKSKREAANQPTVSAEPADLIRRLDAGRQPAEGLGYSLQWWNGAPEDRAAANVSIACGNTSSRVPNAVVLRLPDSEAAPGLYTADDAESVLRQLISIFDPDWAVWTSNELVDAQTEPPQQLDGGGYKLGQLVGHPAGWANYLSQNDSVQFNPALLPQDAFVKQVGGGTLVVLNSDPAGPPLQDVLAMRAAMGYDIPVPQESTAPTSTASSAAKGASLTGAERGEVAQAEDHTAAPGQARKPDTGDGEGTSA